MESLKTKLADFKPILILLYLSATGFLGIMSVQYYFSLKIDPVICFCFMGLVFSIYTFNRYTDYAEDFANDISKYVFFQKKGFFFLSAIISVITTFGVLLFLQKLHWLHVMLILTGFCYSYRIFPLVSRDKRVFFVRLKEIVLLKNLLVSFWWPVSLLCFPILFSSEQNLGLVSIKWIGASLFVLIMNNTLFHDIMDKTGDELSGINTLPTKFGIQKSFLLLWSLDTIMIVAICWAVFDKAIDLKLGLFLGLLTFFPPLYKGLYIVFKLRRGILEFLCETDVILFSIGLLLLKMN